MNKNISAAAKYLLTKARSKMIIEEPFYGNLSMRLEMVETDKFPCMATDGRYQLYNPAWVAEQSVDKLACVLAHEVSHVAMHHQLRRNGRDFQIWNEACDYAVNAELKSGGWSVPGEGLYNPMFEGMSAEQVYASLINEEEEGGGGDKKGDRSEPTAGDQGPQQAGDPGNQPGGPGQAPSKPTPGQEG